MPSEVAGPPAQPPGGRPVAKQETPAGGADALTHSSDESHTLVYPRSGNGVGVAAGVCGIVALAVSWIPFVDYTSLVLGALAIVLAALGVHRANVDPGAGKTMAIVGLVCGIAGFAIAAIVLLLIYALVTTINVAGG
ncbi:MAG: hypothetical protein ACHQ4F_05925 [Candidatus Dormibacteria bacterium]